MKDIIARELKQFAETLRSDPSTPIVYAVDQPLLRLRPEVANDEMRAYAESAVLDMLCRKKNKE